jgi:hypothetical protein
MLDPAWWLLNDCQILLTDCYINAMLLVSEMEEVFSGIYDIKPMADDLNFVVFSNADC